MSLFSKWNLFHIGVFVGMCCLALWLSKQAQQNPCSDVGRMAGVLLSICADHSRPTAIGGAYIPTRKEEEHRSSADTKRVQIKRKRRRHRFTKKQRHLIASMQDYRCFICNGNLRRDLTDSDIDHILPLSKGGADWPDLENLSCIHTSCHRRKTILERR